MFILCTTTICAVAQNLIYIINGILVPVVFALAFIVFLYGIARAYIFSGGDPEKVKEGHKMLMWGIIAFVVMISLGHCKCRRKYLRPRGLLCPRHLLQSRLTALLCSRGAAYGQGRPTYVQCPKDAAGNCI